jgi:hypothetical protein
MLHRCSVTSSVGRFRQLACVTLNAETLPSDVTASHRLHLKFEIWLAIVRRIPVLLWHLTGAAGPGQAGPHARSGVVALLAIWYGRLPYWAVGNGPCSVALLALGQYTLLGPVYFEHTNKCSCVLSL